METIYAVGRRKTAVASIFLKKEKGKILVNAKPIADYFPTEESRSKWMKPFFAIGISNPELTYSGTIKVVGSGTTGQLGAVIHCLARALCQALPESASVLRKQGLLTRDSRMVERKKPYLRKARKAPQYSKR